MRFFDKNKNIILVLIFALFLRILLSLFGTLHLDQGTFIAWSSNLVTGGFRNFYNGWSDYLPGYLYFLWGLGKVNALSVIPDVMLYKLPAILADIATGFLIYKILKKSKSEKWGLIGAAIFLFNPAVIGNSALWGQVDSLTALTSILAVYLLPSNFIISAVVLSVGTLIKPQTAFILPVILFMMIKEKWEPKRIFAYLLIGLLVFIGLFIPFWNNGNLISFIYERLGVSASQYPYTSINAFNFWGVFGFWKPDNVFSQVGGYLAVLVATIFLSIKLSKKKNAAYYLMSFIFAASFVFFTRMHERHLLPVFAPLAIIAVENPIFLIPYIGFSVTYIANLSYSYIWVSDNFRQIFPDMFTKFLSLINVSVVVYIFYTMIKNLELKWKDLLSFTNRFTDSWKKKRSTSVKEKFPKSKLSPKKVKIILGIILAFAFITRTFDLNSPPTMYFDEVYHAFTAKVIMSVDRAKAWEWWNTPPEGFAYEWTHPPVAKLGMVLGMALFGQNSFGWRIPGALLGVGSVLLVYLLAKQIFDDEVIGLLSAGAFSLDGLALVMSRIGMNDSYILFFALLSVYLFMRKKDFWSALFFGLSVASKWSGIWAAPILFVLWLRRKKKFDIKLFAYFLIIPFAVYLLSYLDMFLTGHSLTIWWGMQEQMWWYHTGLKATHPYSSMWWSWPILLRPIYLYTSDEVGGWVARIYAMGNPIVFWFGLVSIITSAVTAFVERNKNLGLVVFSYLIFFAPWALSPRIMFLYHYLPSIPFLAIATGYVLRRNPKLIFTYSLICLLVFIYFYPHWAGLQIPLWLDKSYYWFTSWR